MVTIAPGVLMSEGPGDEPQRCSEIGCPCVIPRPLIDFREGSTLHFVCPSSRITATITPRTRGIYILGGHYTGGLR